MFIEDENMRNKVRFAMFGLLIAVGFALAPSALARGHLGIGINIGLPGLSLGYSDCGRCYGGGYYGGYYAPAPVYYAPGPAYYGPAYYGAVYDGYPAYGSVRYYNGPGRRANYYSGRNDDRGRRNGDLDRRASYYDRSGYRR